MKYTDFLSSVANGNITEEVRNTAVELMEKHSNENAHAAAKRNEKWLAENSSLLEAVANYLREAGRPVIAAEIVNAIDGIENASKARAIAMRIEGIKVGEAVSDKRVVKTYSL